MKQIEIEGWDISTLSEQDGAKEFFICEFRKNALSLLINLGTEYGTSIRMLMDSNLQLGTCCEGPSEGTARGLATIKLSRFVWESMILTKLGELANLESSDDFKISVEAVTKQIKSFFKRSLTLPTSELEFSSIILAGDTTSKLIEF